MLTETDLASLLARSEPLVFVDHGVKLYARTPAGEYAYGDRQGLYEWRDGQRIDYSGGDQQHSDRSGFWHSGPGGDDRPKAGWPGRRGYVAALARRRLN